ncbi:YkgJ family cysteine cluster protein [Oceanisphaera sp. W20_SRM_FM3]|uniref:YkgJ family cysteine cluster protein n=1 Tax=Oceanisphaera sp. W20_SRM_FM3 TaxID=3240267 RepID=UPI003F9D1F83
MISQNQFNEQCKVFHKKYVASKKDISLIEIVSSHLIKPIEAVVAKVGVVACRSGCSHCCHLRVVAFPHEIVAIYFHLNRTLNKEQLDEVKSKIKSQFNIVEGLSESEHFTTNVECPLLVSNKCSVYKVRPIACAGYHSASEAACRKSNENPEVVGIESGGIPMVQIIHDEKAIQNTVATQVINAERDDNEQYELIRGLHQLFNNPSRIQKWKNGRKLF